jgi:hypothetical protein
MIIGSSTGLSRPEAIALDSSGKVYVANGGSSHGGTDSITIYPSGSNGNVTPTALIVGTATGLNLPVGIALDPNGNV